MHSDRVLVWSIAAAAGAGAVIGLYWASQRYYEQYVPLQVGGRSEATEGAQQQRATACILAVLQYQYRPGTISAYFADQLTKYSKRRRGTVQE